MRRPRKMMNQINVVPYIDVMLVLLIIFMVAAPLINPGVIELPSVGQKLATPLEPIEIQVKANGSLLIRDTAREAKAQPVGRNELVSALQQRAGGSVDRPVVIAGDKAVKYEEILKVMDTLQQSQFKRVGLLAKPQK